MAEVKKKEDDKVVMAEFSVSMHCNACERSVAKAISKVKGIEKFMTDMPRHRVVVTGIIKPEKVMKKIRKKTGKKVQIVASKDDSKDSDNQERGVASQETSEHLMQSLEFDCFLDDGVYTMFSDENANACSIM